MSALLGLLTQMTSPDGVADYSYDARGQLTGASYEYQDGEAYSYDANGNRTGGGYVVGDHNRLLSDGTYSYEYEGEGNRIKRTAIATGEVTEYVWDHRNRLVAVVDRLSEEGPIVQSVEYVYDSQNRWIAKSVDPDGDGPEEAVETHFVYQGNQIVLQTDGAGEVTNRYLWGPAVDQILADEQVQVDGSSEVLWPLTDHLNTVRDLAVYDAETDVTTIANHLVYDAFGRVTGQTDPTVTALFGFTARPFDSDTGLQNNLNRWYDAETGTWISVDPMGFAAADANLYRYVGNEAITAVDPSGLERGDWDSLGGWNPWSWWGIRMVPNALTGNSDCYGWEDDELNRKILANKIEHIQTAEDYRRVQQGQLKEAARLSAQQAENGVNASIIGFSGGFLRPSAAASRPANLTPGGAGRSGAFRQAKDAGIPRSQQPSAVRTVPDRTNPARTVREYEFKVPGKKEPVVIREDRGGHTYGPNDPQNRGPHFNTPDGGHYDYQIHGG